MKQILFINVSKCILIGGLAWVGMVPGTALAQVAMVGKSVAVQRDGSPAASAADKSGPADEASGTDETFILQISPADAASHYSGTCLITDALGGTRSKPIAGTDVSHFRFIGRQVHCDLRTPPGQGFSARLQRANGQVLAVGSTTGGQVLLEAH